MTFYEKYGNVLAYQMVETGRQLELIRKEGYKFYCPRLGKHIDLFTYSERDLSAEELEEKKKALEYQERLRDYAEGQVVSPYYLSAWEALKNTEFPDWRN